MIQMNNDTYGAFIAGIGFAALIAGIFQIGLNLGIKTVIRMLDGQYPAAMQYLNKHKQAANILPYIVSGDK